MHTDSKALTPAVFMDVSNEINFCSMRAWDQAALEFNMSLDEIEKAYNTGVARVIDFIHEHIKREARGIVFALCATCDIDITLDHLLEAVHHFDQCTKAVFNDVGAVFGLPAATLAARYDQNDHEIVKAVNGRLHYKALELIQHLQDVSEARKTAFNIH